MGLFSKKKNLINERLIKFGIDFNSFSHEGLDEDELTVDDEVGGVIKNSSGEYEDENGFFNNILIIDYNDGIREIYFSGINVDERKVKNMVDKLSSFLGKDKLFRNELSAIDLEDIRQGGNSDLRSWECDDYNVDLIVNLESNYFLLNVNNRV